MIIKQSRKIFFRSSVMILAHNFSLFFIFLENTKTQLVMIYQDHNSENHYHFKWSVFIIWCFEICLFRTLISFLPLGQSMSLQLCVSERYSFWISSQFWSQVRALVCSPEPHVKLQLDQLFQDEKTKNKLSFLISKYWRRS